MNSDPRLDQVPTEVTWQTVFVCYALIPVVIFGFWAVANPLGGAALLAATIGLILAARRVRTLARCFSECGRIVLDVGETVQICIVRPGNTC